MKVDVEVKQVDSQVTYDFTVSGVFADAASKSSTTGVGLCYPGADADKNDCILLEYQMFWRDGV